MYRISIEEHFSTQEHLDQLTAILRNEYPIAHVMEEEKVLKYEVPFLWPARKQKAVDMLLDIGEGRIKDMDEQGIDFQILSLISPGVQVLDAAAGTSLARKINNTLSQAIDRNRARFSGLASLAPQDPEGAADELERSVTELGLVGATINSHVKGEYLDHKKYWTIFRMAEKLNVPIYLHPRAPQPAMIEPYLKYPMLAGAMIGFAAEVSLHALRLISSGLFEKFPNLKIILGHLGEALPYWLWRIDNIYDRNPVAEKLPKSLSEYFKKNFYISTSGMCFQPPFICAYEALGADRILFAVDYPRESNETAVQFIDSLPIPDSDKQKILHLNAQKLFSL